MNIIIAGDGKVGSTLTRQLVAEGHDITLIDAKAEVLEVSEERYDIMAVQGNCASMATPVSFKHLPAHENVLELVCRLLLEKKKSNADLTS